MRVIYLLGRAPQPRPSFTNDEVALAGQSVDLIPAALTGDGDPGKWIRAPALSSPRLWLSVLKVLASRPLVFARALWAIARPSLGAPRDLLFGLAAALAACYVADRLRADLIHAQFIGPAGAGALVWHRLTKQPYTVRAHAYDIYRPYRWATPILGEAAAVIAISQDGAIHIQQRWGIVSTVVKVGVPPDSVAIRPIRSLGRPARLLTVAALEPKKGHDIALEAMKLLVRCGSYVELDIVGDGSQRGAIETQAGETGSVRLLGHLPVSEVRERYADYDAFLLASKVAPDGDRDGIPVVIMEASLAGLPVVTTRVAGIPELIRDGATGWCVEPDAASIAAAIEEVLGDYDRALKRAQAARQLVFDEHDLRTNVRRLVEIWESVSSRNPADRHRQERC